MNDLLQLKGQFQHSRAPRPGPVELPRNGVVTSEKLDSLAHDLELVRDFWSHEDVPFDPLVSAYYRSVTAKSNRIRRLLSGTKSAADSVVGAKYAGSDRAPRHVITHCVDMATITSTIDFLGRCQEVLERDYDGSMNYGKLKEFHKRGLHRGARGLTKTAFAQCMRDAFYLERFGIEETHDPIDGVAVVSLYDTGYDDDVIGFLHGLGIVITPDRVLGNAVSLYEGEYEALISRYPYLVSMAVRDLNEIGTEAHPTSGPVEVARIPEPANELTIGVIDTPFDRGAYFADWVDVADCPFTLPQADAEPEDFVHGTAVSSLIVDGPRLNPGLDDGCGRFRVRHFGVAKARSFSTFSIMRSIRSIVRSNRDIKVWDLSLGSPIAVSRNFISPEAALLDELQSEFDDIVFVVAGTNRMGEGGAQLVGAPADSINSLVVNATGFDGAPASYSRRGPVLSFFKKPDICCVGGDEGRAMHVCVPAGDGWLMGTSFAAPWIARKMAYLMQVMNLPREVAKALVIDAAASWRSVDDPFMGYGRVPRRIEDVLGSANDEIRFYLFGTSEAYETYNYGIPVPRQKDKSPYIARATLCYFPTCDRRQGVDYTATEMDLHFGRIDDQGRIKPLDRNSQGDPGALLYEAEARKFYRKWDNVKHIGEELKASLRSRKAYGTGLWGIKIRTTERGDEKHGRGMNFGVVVTLKELNGVNRIDDFIRQCFLRGWIVNRIDIENRVDIYNAAEVDIEFED